MVDCTHDEPAAGGPPGHGAAGGRSVRQARRGRGRRRGARGAGLTRVAPTATIKRCGAGSCRFRPRLSVSILRARREFLSYVKFGDVTFPTWAILY